MDSEETIKCAAEESKFLSGTLLYYGFKKENFQDTILLSFGCVMIKEKGAKQYEF